ncbi:MAG: ABC transporter ATP-binding protein, partial [Geminicoccaceae bacterium]
FLRIRMREELKRLQMELGISFVHVTHSQEEAMALADLVVVMNDGVIEQTGAPREVYNCPTSPFVARFIGGHNVLTGTVLSAEGDQTVLEGPGGERFTIVGAERAVGSGITFALRADKVTLHDKTEALGAVGTDVSLPVKTNRLNATVGSVEYQGALVALRLHADSVDEFSLSMNEGRFYEQPVAVGDRVSVGWDARDAHLLS